MPHSKRPRRARVNKKRARLGLPLLPELHAGVAEHMEAHAKAIGVTTIMVPMATPIRAMLTKVRKETQLRDPTSVASDQLFASAILTAMLPQMHAALFPSLIASPTDANMKQAQAVGKVLARPFVG